MSKLLLVDVLAIGAHSALKAARSLASSLPILSTYTLFDQHAFVPRANYLPFLQQKKALPLLKQQLGSQVNKYDDIPIKEIDPERCEVMLINGTRIKYKLLLYAGRQPKYFSQQLRKGLYNQEESIYSLSTADPFLFKKHKAFAQRFFGKIGYFFSKKPFAVHQQIDILQKIDHWKKLNVTNLPFKLTVFAQDQILLPDFPEASKRLQEILKDNKVEVRYKCQANFQQDCKLGMDSLCVRLGREHSYMEQAKVDLDDYDPNTLRLKRFDNIFIPTVHSNSYQQMQIQLQHALNNIRRLVGSASLLNSQTKGGSLWLMDGKGGVRLPRASSSAQKWLRRCVGM